MYEKRKNPRNLIAFNSPKILQKEEIYREEKVLTLMVMLVLLKNYWRLSSFNRNHFAYICLNQKSVAISYRRIHHLNPQFQARRDTLVKFFGWHPSKNLQSACTLLSNIWWNHSSTSKTCCISKNPMTIFTSCFYGLQKKGTAHQ